jgi:DNA-binding response OmpR family regulator
MSKKILIAEDERPMARALVLKLQSSGFEATAVHDGSAVLDAATKANYDLILLDLVMPKLDGFGVLEELKKKKINTPVIITSNLSQKEDEQKARALGAVDYLIKSDTSLAKIVERIKQALGE